MRILFVSDTHGNVDCINSLAEKHGASYCFHAGDVCCFDQGTIPFFSDLELRQMIEHSDVSWCISEKTTRADLEKIASDGHVYGNFYQYLEKEKEFNIPVFAVMGNREDLGIVDALRRNPITNFTILDAHEPIFINKFAFFGIGGTFSEECFEKNQKEKSRIYPVISKENIQQLARVVDAIPSDYKRVFLTHMGPAENSKTTLLARRYAADYVFSGHTHHFSAQDWYCRQGDAIQQLHEEYGWELSPTMPSRDKSITLSFNLPKASRGYMVVAIDEMGIDLSFQYYNTRT